ncbi:MAG TPA: hypothetical protein VK177_00190 [Flavobacteriales bacterium]|nr:hypothetical protein [Flavobacteriales bacterium]
MKPANNYSKHFLPLIFFMGTSAFSFSNHKPNPMELKAEVVFSNQPFIGENPGAKPVNDFKAWDEIYGRVTFSKPIEQLLVGEFENGIADYDPYLGTSLMRFSLKQDDNGVGVAIERRLTAEELKLNYIDFDIAPAETRSRSVYPSNNFGSAVARQNTYFEARKKGTFTMTVEFLDGKGDALEGQNIKNKLTIDYSDIPEGYQGTEKMSQWERSISSAAQGWVVSDNLKKMATEPNITFSKKPFSDDSRIITSSVKAGDPIYGRIVLKKPLKEYVSDWKPEKLQINIKCLNDNITGIAVEKMIRAGELENAYIDFDIFPSPESAKDVYSNNLGFYRTVFSSEIISGAKLRFEFSLASEYNASYNGFKKMEGYGELEIDYAGLTSQQIDELSEKGRKLGEKAEENADRLAGVEGVAKVKTLPMPIVFTRAGKSGYTGYSNATIVQMIKTKFKATEVLMLTFDESDGSGDFSALTDLNNYPTEKIGNHVFYFVFKDPLDGLYKFSGGRLRMLYEGNGKYGEVYIFPYSPLLEADPVFPYDPMRKKLGFDSIFFFDPLKIKR